MNKFNNIYEKFKKDISKEEILDKAKEIQTEFNVKLTDGWNMFIKKDDLKNNKIKFFLMADNKKFDGEITIIDKDYEISWESEAPLENEGLTQGKDLETVLKRMVDEIKDNEK